VSFATPLILIALIAVPALAAMYVGHQRNRRRAAAAFVEPHLTPSVAPHGPGWRRHGPMLALMLALAVLVVAAARPQRTVAVPVERASVMLATDVSGSMQATDVKPSRLIAARRAAQRFVAGVPRKVNVGVMAFNQQPQVLQAPTTDRVAVSAALDRLQPSGATATGEAIQSATRLLNRPGSSITGASKRPPAAIVLLSDGASTRGVDPVTAARRAGRLKIPVYTVALGTANGTITVPRTTGQGTQTRSVPPDPRSLAQVARVSGGRAYATADADRLSQAYERLGSQLGRKNVKREMTAGFAGGSLVLLMLGTIMSLRWFGRLI
jgi:Ca-activated chloride channel family protein